MGRGRPRAGWSQDLGIVRSDRCSLKGSSPKAEEFLKQPASASTAIDSLRQQLATTIAPCSVPVQQSGLVAHVNVNGEELFPYDVEWISEQGGSRHRVHTRAYNEEDRPIAKIAMSAGRLAAPSMPR